LNIINNLLQFVSAGVQLVGDLDLRAARAAESGHGVVAGAALDVVLVTDVAPHDHGRDEGHQVGEAEEEDAALAHALGQGVALARVAEGAHATVAGVTRAAATQAVVPFVAAGPLALTLALTLTPAFAFAHLQFFWGESIPGVTGTQLELKCK